MVRIAVMQNTLNVQEPLVESFDRLVEIGYDGFQFKAGGFEGYSVDALERALSDAGLDVAPSHADFTALSEDPSEVVKPYRAVGCDGIAVSVPDEAFESIEAVRSTADQLSALAAALKDEGFELSYHLHGAEFVDLDGRTALDRFLDRADNVMIEPDIPWVAHGGGNPIELLGRLDGHVPILHFADAIVEERKKLSFGEGNIDLRGIIEAAKETDVEWIVYEWAGVRGYEPLAEFAEFVESV